MKKTRLIKNTYSSLLNQFVVILCGFILPRVYLLFYGSEINGLVASINQFISFISFMELGIGAVVQSSLYKPLAEKNNEKISMILKSASQFFRKIAIIFVIYLMMLMLGYPFVIHSDFGYFYVITLILILSISLFAQYYFGIVNQLLLNADQRSYIVNYVNIMGTIMNAFICTIMIVYFGVGIHVARLISAIIFLIRPLFLNFYVKKHYKIDYKIKIKGEPIEQKWNGLAQHLSSTVLSNTDTIVLSLFCTLSYVSIYSVYYMIVNGVTRIIISFTTGFQSLLGNIIVQNKQRELKRVFNKFEWVMHSLITITFTCVLILILPFIHVYTLEIMDVQYRQPLFALLMIMGQALYCLRTTYYCVIKAAGHYKETQKSAIVEMSLNIVISIVCVYKYGLIGVAIGTLIAITYRTIYCVYYASNIILKRNVHLFYRQCIFDLLTVFATVFVSWFMKVTINTFIQWLLYACTIFCTTLIVFLIINCLFNIKNFKKYVLNRKEN